MSDPQHSGQGYPEHSHEKSDANPGSIAGFEVALLVLAIFSMAAMGGLFYYFTNREAVADTSRSPLATERAVLPPGPTLQVSPATDLEQLHAEENMRLNTYGWVDKEQGVVRIPVEKAMEIVAKQGFPAQLPPATGH